MRKLALLSFPLRAYRLLGKGCRGWCLCSSTFGDSDSSYAACGVKTLKQKTGSAADQHREFVKAARELGTDENEEAFDRVLGKIAKAPPPKSVQKRKKKPSKRRR